MNHSKIGTAEAIMLILSVIVAHTILSLPKTIVSVTKTATILNLIYVTIIIFAIVYLIYLLMKKFPGMDLIDISKYLAGSIFQKILGSIFIFYFIISSGFLLRNFCECLKIVYYPNTDIIFVIFFFIIAICISNQLRFSATLKTNLLVIPLAIISIIFLFFSNIRNFSLQRALPILGDGFFTTFVTGIGNIAAFGGIVFLYFLPPLLKQPEKFKKIAFSSIALTALYLILTTSIILFMFSFFMTEDEIAPLYSATRYIEFGTFFQRLESVFLLIWMILFSCYLSITVKFSIYIFQKITNIKDTRIIMIPFALCIFAIALLPKNYAISKFYETDIYPYLVWGLVFIISISILIFANIKKKRKKVGDHSHEEIN